MLVHEVWCQGEQILDELVGDAVVSLKSGQVFQLNEAIFVDIYFFHDEESYIASHFG